jgi:predicted dienelactone hydrolase
MRRPEALLWISNLVTFFAGLALPRFTVHWTRYLACSATLIGVAQVSLERPRWQSVPTYTLTLLVVLISIRAADTSVVDNRFAISLGTLGLAFALALPTIFPVLRFAQPNGPYGIGTLPYHWTDETRSEVFIADSKQRRQLMVQVWYPAKARLSAARPLHRR